MKYIYIVFICLSVQWSIAQTVVKDRILYGPCKRDSLMNEPFRNWYFKNYQEYQPNQELIKMLKKQPLGDLEFVLYFGSWCGDSKRELPKFIKILDELGIAQSKYSIIALGGSDSLYKQSPTGEEKGNGIYRVPVFIIKKKGNEIGRINELAVSSLERDVWQIVSGQNYVPNYAAFQKIMTWQNDGTLADENVTATGLANQIRPWVSSEYTLNSLAYLYKKQGFVKESFKLFKINYNLYSESQTAILSLAEAFLENKEKDKAISFFEMALQQEKDKEQWRAILEKLYKAKGI